MIFNFVDPVLGVPDPSSNSMQHFSGQASILPGSDTNPSGQITASEKPTEACAKGEQFSGQEGFGVQSHIPSFNYKNSLKLNFRFDFWFPALSCPTFFFLQLTLAITIVAGIVTLSTI